MRTLVLIVSLSITLKNHKVLDTYRRETSILCFLFYTFFKPGIVLLNYL